MTVPPPHNLTILSNSTGIIGLTTAVNEVFMKNLFGIFVLVTIFILTMLGFMLSTNNAGKSFAASAFICFGLSIFLRVLGWVPDLAMYGSLAIAAFSIAFIKSKE